MRCRGVAQSGSVFVWGAKGRGFESRHSDQNKKYHDVVFFVLLWCHDLNTINCNAISGSTSSRFCKRQRSENVTIAPQAFMPRVSRHSDHQFSLLRMKCTIKKIECRAVAQQILGNIFYTLRTAKADRKHIKSCNRAIAIFVI